MKGFLGVAVCATVLSVSAACAEPVELLISQYEPFIDTEAGRVESCGLMYTAILMTIEKRYLMLQGSVSTLYWKGKSPTLVIKVSVFEASDKDLANKPISDVPRKVHSASFSVGQTDTRVMRAFQSPDDKKSLFLMTKLEQAGDFVFEFPPAFERGAWVSFSLDSEAREYNFRLPALSEADTNTRKQVKDCHLLGITTLQRELEALAEERK